MDVLDRVGVDRLIHALAERGYQVIGPTVRDGAIVLDRVASSDDLPRGWTDRQAAGAYRLERRTDEALFGYVVGPQSWKSLLFPPRSRLLRVERDGRELGFRRDENGAPPMAFLGVRPCELAAIAVQDRVLLAGPSPDSAYRARRESAFLVCVACGESAETCFCASRGTGPGPTRGFDLALTELLDGGDIRYLAAAGSDRGRELLAELPRRPATAAEVAAAAAAVAAAAASQARELDDLGVRELLLASLESPRWAEIGERCLACANCTMVCPTCFCATVTDSSALDGRSAERWRTWDSCFALDHSYVHGGSVRVSTAARYRQWLVHKLATWHDQFGISGCVGCGRCITWCPVGIDLTAEVAAFRAATAAPPPGQEEEHGDRRD